MHRRLTPAALLLVLGAVSPAAQQKDWRNIENAYSVIPDEGYCDQPYVVENPDGSWLCVMTTGPGREGQRGQHIVAVRSVDRGKTWSKPVDIEPADGPEASWVVPLLAPSGRVYAIYTYNADNLRSVFNHDRRPIRRVDTLGKMMLKYSDDRGRTWSRRRYEVPIREFEIDRNNVYGGKVRFFWSVSKPIIRRGAVYMAVSKVGDFGDGFMRSSEGVILKSANMLTESDPARFVWETLPDGDVGLRAPVGEVADEHNLVSLSDGSLYCTYRTNQGRNCHAYSRDGGRTWTPPAWARYAPGGQLMKQPRCFNKVTKFSNGKFVLFFHNNGARHYSSWPPGNRNPAWLSGGVEKDGFIHWSQPEILLYDPDYAAGISYPDWIESNGEYYITETQKTIARLHKIPAEFLKMLWGQFDRDELTRDGCVLDLDAAACRRGESFQIPPLPRLFENRSFTFELWLKTGRLDRDQVLLDTRYPETVGVGYGIPYKDQGIVLKATRQGALEADFHGVTSRFVWDSGEGSLKPDTPHHAVMIVDGAAKVLYFVIDGRLCDGGDRPFGFGRLDPYLADVSGRPEASFSPDFEGEVTRFRVYNRALRTTEAIGNFRAGLSGAQ